MRHIISVLLENESGALARLVGLFAQRGYNIDSLNVAPTDDPTVSRLTLVTTGNEAVIQQISNQLLKLVDVVDVEDVTREAVVDGGGAGSPPPPQAAPAPKPAPKRPASPPPGQGDLF